MEMIAFVFYPKPNDVFSESFKNFAAQFLSDLQQKGKYER